MNWYTETTVKFWPHYNIFVGLSNLAWWGPSVVLWVPPIMFPLVNVIIGILCIYWGIQGLRHQMAMKRRLTKLKSPV